MRGFGGRVFEARVRGGKVLSFENSCVLGGKRFGEFEKGRLEVVEERRLEIRLRARFGDRWA